MSLVRCPECGTEISDKALSCIKCGYPISQMNVMPQKWSEQDIEKLLKLAIDSIKSKDSPQVLHYCQQILEIDPTHSKAWEYEARGILFDASLKENRVLQAIIAAENAINYYDGNKAELAKSLYDKISNTVVFLIAQAKELPTEFGSWIDYITLCFNYIEKLLSLPALPKEFVELELCGIAEMEKESKKAFFESDKKIWYAHFRKPPFDVQIRESLQRKGIL